MMVASEKIARINKSTPSHTTGFADRFFAICLALDKKKFGRVRFLTTISGLSWSGAKVCIKDDRPPKRIAALRLMGIELSKLLKSKNKIEVTPDEVQAYLISGAGPLEERLHGFVDKESENMKKWDISGISSSLNARVVLMIHKIANNMNVDVFSDLDKQQFELLNRKMTVYCHQHSEVDTMETDSEIMELIRSMIIVAHAKLQ